MKGTRAWRRYDKAAKNPMTSADERSIGDSRGVVCKAAGLDDEKLTFASPAGEVRRGPGGIGW